MIRTILAAALLVGCVDSGPSLPEIRITAIEGQEQLTEYQDGALVWSALGFSVGNSDLPECERRWYETGNAECAITILVTRDPLLRERTGTDALSNRTDRTVAIDSELTNEYNLIVAVAHEVGHIVLDTPKHTQGGVMGGASARLERVDYELACSTIHVCVQ